MMKNKLFKLENDQSTKQISNTLKKNELFKRENNQGTNQISIRTRDSMIIACNPTKNELTLRNLPRPQSLKSLKKTHEKVPFHQGGRLVARNPSKSKPTRMHAKFKTAFFQGTSSGCF